MSRFVLVPGFGGAADWDFVAPMLRRDHEVVIADGDIPLDTDRDTILVGYGPGAVRAAAHASAHPVGALVLLAGWLEPTDRLSEWAAHASDAVFARHTMMGPESARTPIVRPELFSRLAALPVPTPTDVDAPTLVVGATYDLVATAHQSRLLYGAIADAHYVELPTGHAMLIERPAEVLGLLSTFAAQPSVTPVLLP